MPWSGIFWHLSTITKMAYFPLDFGKHAIKSIDICNKANCGIDKGDKRPVGHKFEILFVWQIVHSPIQDLIVFTMFFQCQWNVCWTLRKVFSNPSCVVSWISFKMRGIRVEEESMKILPLYNKRPFKTCHSIVACPAVIWAFLFCYLAEWIQANLVSALKLALAALWMNFLNLQFCSHYHSIAMASTMKARWNHKPSNESTISVATLFESVGPTNIFNSCYLPWLQIVYPTSMISTSWTRVLKLAAPCYTQIKLCFYHLEICWNILLASSFAAKLHPDQIVKHQILL